MSKSHLDADLVRAMAGLLDETGLTELEYATQAVRIRIARNPAPVAFAGGFGPAPIAPAATAAAAGPVVEDLSHHPGAVTSPMVGTVYLSPEPGAPAFIRVGDSVRQGQTLLIIEAMKVMNPLSAPKDGVVSRILIGDAQPVEYGEALLIIE